MNEFKFNLCRIKKWEPFNRKKIKRSRFDLHGKSRGHLILIETLEFGTIQSCNKKMT
jgi:hypothetical protein